MRPRFQQLESPPRTLIPLILTWVCLGVLLALAFPPGEIWATAWLVPGLILLVAFSTSAFKTFCAAAVSGTAFWLCILYWLLHMPVPKILSALAWCSLSIVLGILIGLWGWFSGYWIPRKVLSISPSLTINGAKNDVPLEKTEFRHKLQLINSRDPIKLTLWAFLTATSWSAIESLRTHLLWGFPWIPLGSSQYKMIPLIQISSITGCYGVSFIIVYTSVSVLFAICKIVIKPTQLNGAMVILAPAAILLTTLCTWGYYKTAHTPTTYTSSNQLKIALIQPAIPQLVIWDPTMTPMRQKQLMDLTIEAARNKPDLIIWPEASLPEFTEDFFSALIDFVHTNNVWLIFGADEVELGYPDNKPRVYNAAFLMDPSGKISSIYRKRRLVPFGEFIPLEQQLPFLKKVIPVPGSLTPGSHPVVFRIKTTHNTNPLICFEDTFPDLARIPPDEKIDFLLNITNDGWFGESAAHWQHMITALFRAVENGVPLVRCANNGISCYISPTGKPIALLRDHRGSYYGPGILHVTLDKTLPIKPTFYRRFGDVFANACAVIGIMCGVTGILRKTTQ